MDDLEGVEGQWYFATCSTGAALRALHDQSRARMLESCCMMTSSFQIADASSGLRYHCLGVAAVYRVGVGMGRLKRERASWSKGDTSSAIVCTFAMPSRVINEMKSRIANSK